MSKTKKNFNNRASLNRLIDEYFERSKNDTGKLTEPVTLTGLALYLGFTSKEAFDEYEQKKYYSEILVHARFRVLAYYESRLHFPSPTGAIYALKSMGWEEKVNPSKQNSKSKSLTVNIIQSGPKPASAEKDVAL